MDNAGSITLGWRITQDRCGYALIAGLSSSTGVWSATEMTASWWKCSTPRARSWTATLVSSPATCAA